MDNTTDNKVNDKPVGRQALYSMASRHAKRAIGRLVELIESPNENIALGAARTLLDKTLPNTKSVEISSQEDSELKVIIMDYESKINESLEKVYGSGNTALPKV